MSSGLFPARIDRPVFVIAAPRSGSTFLFECLVQFEEFTTFADREGTYLWQRVLPYGKRRDVSDDIAPDEFGSWRRRCLATALYARTLLKAPATSRRQTLARLVRRPRLRYLDKSIANTFHVPLLREMFPDATFVHLIREPRANIASMIRGWSHEDFQKPALDRYLREAGSPLDRWTYAAPPGWQDMVHRSLPEICAWMWQQHADAIDASMRSRGGGPLIRYEDLVADAPAALAGLADQLGLTMTPAIREYLSRPPQSRTTLGQSHGTTRDESIDLQVEAVLPAVADTAARFGYSVPGERRA